MNRTFWAIAGLLLLSALGAHAALPPVIYQAPSYISLAYLTYTKNTSQPMTIRGANLTGTSRVTIGGLEVEALTVVDDNTVTFRARKPNPYLANTYQDLVLTAPGGSITLPNAIYLMDYGGAGVTVKGSDWAVLLEVVATATPTPAITLTWPVESKATGYEISRNRRAETTWTPVGTAAGNATKWTDTTVAVGQAYEYQVKRTSTIMAYPDALSPAILTGLTSYGYCYAGIIVPPVDHRGTVILIVDKTIAGPCSAELALLQEDLRGDGWSVIRHDVPRGTVNKDTGPSAYEATGAPAVKQLIVNEYLKNPREVKSVLLFGHVPVPYSGNYTPTAHAPVHTGAFPADVYYGDIDGVWTDTVVNVQTGTELYYSCWNIPGDGKFDQSWVPSAVELEVGRVDLWGMGADEVALLKQYIRKSHDHRHANTVLPRRTLIEGSSDDSIGAGQSGWRSWSPLVGAGKLETGSFFEKVVTNQEAFLGYCLAGGGDNARIGPGNRSETVYSGDFLNKDIKTAFCMTWGSHHGDWDHSQNLLRAPLTSATSGLTNMYAYFPTSYLHTLGLGGTIGEAIRLKQNNTTTYAQYDAQNSGGVHIALMGDPTLRLFAVQPPSGLTIKNDGNNHPVLTWQAPTDSPQVRYYVYRGSDPNGPFARVTPTPLTQTTWTDSRVASGMVIYQVKAAKLEITPSGSYVNTSQAITGTLTAPGAAEVILATPTTAMPGGPGTIYQQEPVAVPEGNNGITKMTITCLRVGGSTGQVVVQYSACAPGRGVFTTAIPVLDFAVTQGTLTWDDGDMTPKTFTIDIKGNLKPEPIKNIPIRYSVIAGSATVQHPESFHNYIVNDDGVATGAK